MAETQPPLSCCRRALRSGAFVNGAIHLCVSRVIALQDVDRILVEIREPFEREAVALHFEHLASKILTSSVRAKRVTSGGLAASRSADSQARAMSFSFGSTSLTMPIVRLLGRDLLAQQQEIARAIGPMMAG